MANLFSKIGSSVANLGQGNSLFGNQTDINTLKQTDPEKYKVAKKEGMQRLLDTVSMMNARGSGDAQKIALASEQIKERKLAADQEEFLRNNPQYANQIRMQQLFNISPTKPAKVTKSDYVVDILNKIKNHKPTAEEPTYKISAIEQQILDTISDTDELSKMKREIIKEIQLNQSNDSGDTNSQSSGKYIVETVD